MESADCRTGLLGGLEKRIGHEAAGQHRESDSASDACACSVGMLFAIGAVIASWSLLILHRARTTTVPGRASTKLVTWGPYRFTRNPMYVGLVCAYLGGRGF